MLTIWQDIQREILGNRIYFTGTGISPLGKGLTFSNMEVGCFFFSGLRLFCFHTENWNIFSTWTAARQNHVQTIIIQNCWIEDFAAKRIYSTVQYFQFITAHQRKNNRWEWNFKSGNCGLAPPWVRHLVVLVRVEQGPGMSRWSKEVCQLGHVLSRFNRTGLV